MSLTIVCIIIIIGVIIIANNKKIWESKCPIDDERIKRDILSIAFWVKFFAIVTIVLWVLIILLLIPSDTSFSPFMAGGK